MSETETLPPRHEVDPIARFGLALARAEAEGLPQANAMALGTVGDDGLPSVRMVLLKAADARGFVFYTNLTSRKARELLARPAAALCFHWAPFEEQVRVEGPVERVSEAEADEYFRTRPRGSQIGAWASRQSQPLASRAELVERVEAVEARFSGREVERPPHWSGFRVVPRRIEFWHGRPDRLHDRWVFERTGPGAPWAVRQLFP